ncbi:hypothetical protein RSD66_13825 [Brevundimonas sp. S1H14]|uniref:hypothetical protein n=1 Tax=Brevundimonas sp. S1H14 TaxID=3078084 RepID=UPI0039E818E1
MKTSAVVLTVLCAALATGGCVKNYPTREAVQGASAGTLKLSNAPADARLIVDGRDLGSVGALGGGAALTPGRHEVVVRQGDRTLHAQTVIVAAGAQAVVVVP